MHSKLLDYLTVTIILTVEYSVKFTAAGADQPTTVYHQIGRYRSTNPQDEGIKFNQTVHMPWPSESWCVETFSPYYYNYYIIRAWHVSSKKRCRGNGFMIEQNFVIIVIIENSPPKRNCGTDITSGTSELVKTASSSSETCRVNTHQVFFPGLEIAS